MSKQENWICFPDEENWDKETEICGTSVHLKHGEYQYRGFLGIKHIQKYAGQRCFSSKFSDMQTCFTIPTCVLLDDFGYLIDFKDHPKVKEIEESLIKALENC